VARKVAQLKSLSMDEVAEITSANAAFIFGN
jgi:Tat protein secretion system quality control protein TatD with DNase activity